MPVIFHVTIREPGELGGALKHRGFAFAPADEQILQLLPCLGGCGRFLQGHATELLQAGVLVLHGQLGIGATAADPQGAAFLLGK